MGGIDDFGRFGSIPIKYSQGNYFYNQVAYFNNMYRDIISDNPDYFEIYRRNIWQSAFSETVNFTAIKYFMEKSGFDISTSKLDRLIVESGYFSDSLGKFDPEAYSQASINRKESIRASLENSQFLQQYSSDVLGGIYKSDEQIDFISDISPEERMIGFISINSENFPEERIIEEGNKNRLSFQSRDLSRIVVETEKEAKEVVNQLNDDNSNFADLAINYSRDYTASEGGNLPGRFYYEISDELDEESADTIFSLGTGEVTSPMETQYGWYIYKAETDIVEPDFSDETMISTVKTWLNWNQGEILEQWAMEEAENLRNSIDPADPSSFALSAFENGYEVKQSGYFTLNWGGSQIVGASVATGASDPVLQNAVKSEEFYETVFSMNLDEVSKPISLGKNIIIVQLMDIRDSQSTVSNQYIKNYLQQDRDQMWRSINNESELLKNNFEEAYNKVFPSTGS